MKEGLRSLIKTGFWKHFSQFSIDSFEEMFRKNFQGKMFITANNHLVQGFLVRMIVCYLIMNQTLHENESNMAR